MKKNKKFQYEYFVLILILFSFIGILIRSTFIKENTSKITPNKFLQASQVSIIPKEFFTIEDNIYHSNEYNFSVTSPTDLEVFVTNGGNLNFYYKNDNNLLEFTLMMQHIPEKMTVHEWFEEVTSSLVYLVPSNNDYTVETILIGKNVWTKFTNIASPPASYLKYALSYKGTLYYVVDSGENEKIIEKMLNTIKFDHN